MSGSPGDEIAATGEIIGRFLARPDVTPLAAMALQAGLNAEQAPALLERIVETRALPAPWEPLWAEAGESEPLLGRWMVALAARRSLQLLAEAPLAAEVRQLISRNYEVVLDSGRTPDRMFLPASREFRETAEIALLRRFVAGQLHWNVSGIPRSWALQMNGRDALRTFGTVWRMGGWSPCFEVHIPSRGAPFLIESEYTRCYLRIARSMELQPAIRGVMGSSWLHAEETMRISAHLGWMNRLFLENGGVLVHLGAAPPDSGFLVGSQQRKQLYESGAYRPRNAMFIWPREAFLEWARRQ